MDGGDPRRSPRGIALLGAFGLSLSFVAGAGCSRRLSSPAPAPVVVDAAAPANRFDGVGSMFTGRGWAQPDAGATADDWSSMAWVVGREALVYVKRPLGEEMNFFARCLPFPFAPDAPAQEMELLRGDQILGRVTLARGWHDVSIPIPEDASGGQLLELRLRFRHATRPVDVGVGQDERSLAAAFTTIALVPREVKTPGSFLEEQAFDAVTRRGRITPGGGLEIPLPAAALVSVALSDLKARCARCELTLTLAGPSESRTLLRRGLNDESKVAFDLGTDPQGGQSLRLGVSGDRQGIETGLEFKLEASWHPSAARAPARSPNVFVYMIDTLRADALAPTGGKTAATPNAAALAADGVTYLGARAASSWTLPSVVSVLTGVYPDRHGVMAGDILYDANRLPSFPRLLHEHGYRTVGISHSFIVSAAYGLTDGFDDFYLSNQLNGWQLRSQEAVGLLASWLSLQTTERPLFAYLHTVDPHSPYSPPLVKLNAALGAPGSRPSASYVPEAFVASGLIHDPAEVAHLRGLYDDEVAYADEQFGRFVDLLKWLGLYDDSLIVLTGDHGEEFAEHDGVEHGETLFGEAVRVPLIVKYPGGRWAGEQVADDVSLVDLAPTILHESGAPPSASPDGRLLPSPGSSRRGRALYLEVRPARDASLNQPLIDLRAMVAGNFKCIENRAGMDRFGRPAPPLLAYQLDRDPAEKRPLDDDPSLARCRRLFADFEAGREALAREGRSRLPATDETLEQLRALGYLN